MDRPKLEVADVFRHHGEAYRQERGASLSMAQCRVLTAIEVCRTAVLGGHLEQGGVQIYVRRGGGKHLDMSLCQACELADCT